MKSAKVANGTVSIGYVVRLKESPTRFTVTKLARGGRSGMRLHLSQIDNPTKQTVASASEVFLIKANGVPEDG